MEFNYLIIIIILIISTLISFLLFSIVYLLIFSKKDVEKVSTYECGFHSFKDTRQQR